MGRLSTHVLDTARGVPAAGMVVELHWCESDGTRKRLRSVTTNSDGRTDGPLLQDAELLAGTYELLFRAGDYLRGLKLPLSEPLFLDEIVIRFGVSDLSQNYHVPLLLSPYGYSTYRGS